jgi:hypothetical protein
MGEVEEDDCPYCAGAEEVEARLADGSTDYIPCPHSCHRIAALDASGAGWVPPGWKLVPEVPTEAMLFKADRCVPPYKRPDLETVRNVWAAMIAAAPTPDHHRLVQGEEG